MDCRVQFSRVVCVLLFLVALSLVTCIVSGLYHDVKRVTYTRCGSYEVLPSISAAVDFNGYHRILWQIPILLQCIEHAMLTYLLYHYHQTPSVRISISALQSYSPWSGVINVVTTAVDLFSIISLFSLSFVTSTLAFPFHKNSVIVYMLSTALHMVLATWQQWYRNVRPYRDREGQQSLKNQQQQLMVGKSLRLKLFCLGVNILAISLGTHFYVSHGTYCRAYTYSKFAMCEYAVVVAALGFHYSQIWDLPPAHLSLSYAESST